MRTITYNDSGSYPLVFLVRDLDKRLLEQEYMKPFGLDENSVAAITLFNSPGKKKTPVGEIKSWITQELVDVLKECDAAYLVVSDAEYFKVLTGEASADANIGYVLDCVYGPWKVVYIPNYKTVFYNPETVRAKIARGMEALKAIATGSTYIPPGEGIIKHEHYPSDLKEIRKALDKLLSMNCDLTCDTEAFSLKHFDAGIGSISFAWNKHEGIAFLVDYEPIEGATEAPYGKQVINHVVREELKRFFVKFYQTGRRMIYHNISYDVYNLIYQLFMKDILDTEGLLDGMTYLLTEWEDTKLITYLATNSCAGNELGLKIQAQEFAGNYAESDINDITKIKPESLLRYNLIDCLSTWFVYEKHWQTMIDDDQMDVYKRIFKPAILDIIQMQLTGLPINMEEVYRVAEIMENDLADSIRRINSLNLVKEYEYQRIDNYVTHMNQKWKKKRTTIAEVQQQIQTNTKLAEELMFNPNSPKQLQEILFGQLELPILDYTKTKQPATDSDTIKALKNHTSDPNVLEFLNALSDYSSVYKVLTSFIPAFKNAAKGPDGWHYLFGNFNLGGTVSGRLSSSNPNLQNIPASSDYAKLIKSCVQARQGWLFVGLDFASLEDRISALTTKDPNKLKVYTDGYDGHCLRAHAYFGKDMPDIDPDSVESINSIAKLYKKQRQDSKAPTFALTYQGTYITLMKNCGFTKEQAQSIEASYRSLYSTSIKWVEDKLNQASKDGYVTVAFGLRVRTPMLKQVIRGNSRTPSEAEAEGRTAGNALGQSWCLLNSRAGSEFMGKVRNSKYRLKIRPCAQIHDAQYFIIPDDIEVLKYVNEHLVEAVKWQDDPVIYHDDVKLGGELSIFHPNWNTEIVIPNSASDEEITQIINKSQQA